MQIHLQLSTYRPDYISNNPSLSSPRLNISSATRFCFKMPSPPAFIPSKPFISHFRHGPPSQLCQTLSRHTSPIPRAELRTCRRCKQTFLESENHSRACRYHSGLFTGDSKRKGVWADEYVKGSGNAERFWWYVTIEHLAPITHPAFSRQSRPNSNRDSTRQLSSHLTKVLWRNRCHSTRLLL